MGTKNNVLMNEKRTSRLGCRLTVEVFCANLCDPHEGKCVSKESLVSDEHTKQVGFQDQMCGLCVTKMEFARGLDGAEAFNTLAKTHPELFKTVTEGMPYM